MNGLLKELEIFSLAAAIFLVIVIIVLLYGAGKTWKVNKFYSFICIALAVVAGIALYAFFGEKIFGA